MITILQLLPGDLYTVVSGAREFYKEMSLPGEFKADNFTQSWSMLMNLNLGTIFAAFEDGNCVAGIGAIIYPCPNTGDQVATEAFWYVRSTHRKGTTAIRLLKEFEAWGKRRKASRLVMGALANSPEAVTRLYKRSGYTPLEQHWMKQLS